MKGQSTIEFLGGALLFLLVIAGSLSIISQDVNRFQDQTEQSSKNMEIYTLTQQLMTSPGKKPSGTNWEDNTQQTQQAGLANEYLTLQWDKIKALSTTGQNKLNYTQFRNIHTVNNQYRLTFTWLPIVETSKSFTRTEPPSKITEPNSSLYQSAENRVHYGILNLNSTEYKFSVTAHNGVYNTTRVSTDWNFSGENPEGNGDEIMLDGKDFKIKKFQNRERRPGASIILEREIKTFGANPREVNTPITKLNRFASLEAPGTDTQPVRIEVLAW